MSPYFTKSNKTEKRWADKFAHNNYLGRCVYCGVWLNLRSDGVHTDRHAVSVDHVKPVSRGGRVTVNACVGCNADKHDLSLTEWRMLRLLRTRRILFHYEVEALRAVCTIACVRIAPLLACV